METFNGCDTRIAHHKSTNKYYVYKRSLDFQPWLQLFSYQSTIAAMLRLVQSVREKTEERRMNIIMLVYHIFVSILIT